MAYITHHDETPHSHTLSFAFGGIFRAIYNGARYLPAKLAASRRAQIDGYIADYLAAQGNDRFTDSLDREIANRSLWDDWGRRRRM